MPRNYYCHYCSVHIPNTRDSRSSHNLGSAHRSNVKRYYELIQLDQAGIVSHIPVQIGTFCYALAVDELLTDIACVMVML
ncbi:hypothetical protein QVD99_007158 [Batrachochytrium dendrobatidis]|nr:hypothetical protein O5D80_007566 [Batrachochytrium dendrobatidis]KAK5666403.1 hypothetical protein QVD99_007158 [Batrachochytrium dendrobatidis]